MEEKKLVPKLRFPGFTEPWEQRKLGEIFKERNERSGQGELISVTVSQGVIKAADLDRDINASIDKHNYKVVKPGDVVYNTMRMWQGACGHSPYRGILSPAYTVLIPGKNTLGTLFDYYFKRIELLQIFKKYSQGMTSDTWNLKFDILKQVKLPFPSVEEQGKIVQLFSSCDANITLHQRKLEHLKLKKKSLLQKLFPKEGEVYPELRFPGFTDPWEQRKLGEDILSIHTGTNILGSETNDGIPLLKMGNLRNGYFDFSKLEYLPRNIDIDKQDIIKYGDFLFNTRNTLELVGKGATWTMESKKFAFNGNIARFDLKSDIDTIFFNYLYNTSIIMRQIHARATGTTSVAAIYTNTLNNLIYRLPIKDEQTKIGNFFQQLDSLITLHQRKLEHLQLLKKALLQQLFV